VTTALSHHGLQRRHGPVPAASSDHVPVPALPPYEGPTPAIKPAAAAVGEEQRSLPLPGTRSGDEHTDVRSGAPAAPEEAEPAGGVPSADAASTVAAAAADAVREENGDAGAADSAARFANGDNAKEHADYENGEDYDEDGGESYESTDTYGVTPRSDEQ